MFHKQCFKKVFHKQLTWQKLFHKQFTLQLITETTFVNILDLFLKHFLPVWQPLIHLFGKHSVKTSNCSLVPQIFNRIFTYLSRSDCLYCDNHRPAILQFDFSIHTILRSSRCINRINGQINRLQTGMETVDPKQIGLLSLDRYVYYLSISNPAWNPGWSRCVDRAHVL